MTQKTQDINASRADEQLRITVRIADTEPIQFPVKRSEERLYRQAEYHVNQLWRDWAKAYPRRSTADLMARVALAFAELYYRKTDQIEQATKLLGDFEHELDRLLSPPTPEEL